MYIKKNKFINNEIAVGLYHNGNSFYSTTRYELDLKCNTFTHETLSGTSRKGLVIGPDVVVGSYDPGSPYNFSEFTIGGSFTLGNTGNRPIPNANVWPTTETDRTREPKDEFGIPVDIDDPSHGWQDPSNWTAIENNSGIDITYFLYKNEFVKNKGSILPNVLWDGPEVKIATQGSTLVSGQTYEFACDSPLDPWPVLFPARISLISENQDTKKVQFENILEDPIPNPARNSCRIPFKLIPDSEQAILQIIEVGTGRVLQNVTINERGFGEVQLDLSLAPSGVYSYRLLVNGLPGLPKKLVITH